MDAKNIVPGPEGRRLIVEEGRPTRVALPMHVIENAATDQEKDLLLRFTEASEMAKGNMAVAIVGNEPRGRYALYADRVDPQTYAAHEVAAYKWILQDIGYASAVASETIARLNGERMNDLDFEQFGARMANTTNRDVAIGAAIGITRADAWKLRDAYKRYYAYWKAAEERRRKTLNVIEGFTPGSLADAKTG